MQWGLVAENPCKRAEAPKAQEVDVQALEEKDGDQVDDLSKEIKKVALQLNERPRKTLGFDTPAARLSAYVASTG